MKSPTLINKKLHTIECSCGCGTIDFGYYIDEKEFYISYNIPAFYSHQGNIFKILFRRLKLAWFILLGKEYCLYETVIESQEILDNFKNFISEIDMELVYE